MGFWLGKETAELRGAFIHGFTQQSQDIVEIAEAVARKAGGLEPAPAKPPVAWARTTNADEKPLEPIAPVNPQPDQKPDDVWGRSLQAMVTGDPHFINPDVNDRLTLLHRMVQAYNHRGPYEPLDKPSRARIRQHLYDKSTDAVKFPTGEEARDWFTALTPRQRVELSPMFRDRQKYLEQEVCK